MGKKFEHLIYKEADRITVLEKRAAELERLLLEVAPTGGRPRWDANTAEEGGQGLGARPAGRAGQAPRGSDGRTEALINRGRQRARAPRTRWLRKHWRATGLGMAAAGIAALILALGLPGGGASWPASVAQVQGEITAACQNPNVAAEPSQDNFACARPTQSILWIFSLLTSGDNPAFIDQATGRKGLEPISPAQGGDIAWSLNLHHPYNPASPVDSLQVAARAINNIISGATLTSPNGTPMIEAGLESKAANCQRYTGSAQLIARPGFPARCAKAVTSGAGQAALVSDVFQQWMGGTPAQIAAQAGVLFRNADNPGDPQVQAIIASLPQ